MTNLVRLIGGGPFSLIDDDDLDWTFSGLETQPKLLLQRLRDGYTRCVRPGRRRRHCRSGIVRREFQLQVEESRKSGLVDYTSAEQHRERSDQLGHGDLFTMHLCCP